MDSRNWHSDRVNYLELDAREGIELGLRDITVRKGKAILTNKGEWLTEYMSCSDLGLEQHEKLIKAVGRSVDKWGVQLAAARTRLKTENIEILEKLLHKIFLKSFTLVFPNLHSLHFGALPLLASSKVSSFQFNEKPSFIVDKYAHASIQINKSQLEHFAKYKRISISNFESLKEKFQIVKDSDLTPIVIKEFFRLYRPTYIFRSLSTLPIINIAIKSCKIHLSTEISNLQNKLWENIDFLLIEI